MRVYPTEFKNKVKRELREEPGVRLFQEERKSDKNNKEDVVLLKVKYPDFKKEIYLKEWQVNWVINKLTSNDFLDKELDFEYPYQELGGIKRHHGKDVYDEDSSWLVSDCSDKIRNYIHKNKDWYEELLEKAQGISRKEAISEDVLLFCEGYFNFWDINSEEVFKDKMNEFRKKYKINVERFKELRGYFQKKYEKCLKSFSFYKSHQSSFSFDGMLSEYSNLNLKDLIEIKEDLLRRALLNKKMGAKEDLMFWIRGDVICVENLKNFEIRMIHNHYQTEEEMITRISFYELIFKEDEFYSLNKLRRLFRNYKIPKDFEILVKNYLFYDYLEKGDWRLYKIKNLPKDKSLNKRREFSKNYLIFLLKENRGFVEKIRKINQLKNEPGYNLFGEINSYLSLKNDKEKLEKEINEEEIKIEEIKIVNLYFPAKERLNQKKRHLERLTKILLETKQKIKNLLKNLGWDWDEKDFEVNCKKFINDFANKHSDILVGDKKYNFYEIERRQLLWLFSDIINKWGLEEFIKDDLNWGHIDDFLKLCGLDTNKRHKKGYYEKEYYNFLKQWKIW